MTPLTYIPPDPRGYGGYGGSVNCAVCGETVLPSEPVFEVKGSHPVRYLCTACTGELAGQTFDARTVRHATGVDEAYEAARADLGGEP